MSLRPGWRAGRSRPPNSARSGWTAAIGVAIHPSGPVELRAAAEDEIAERLVVSPATAKTHVSRVMNELDARDRAQVVVAAYGSGLVKRGHSDASRDTLPT